MVITKRIKLLLRIIKFLTPGRDIVKNLMHLKVASIADFNWISQMRYYWTENVVVVSMITTDVMYGFEYLGNTGRLVATPLTDRCFR